ncbi:MULTISPECIES: hypothetical protein [unclassified Bacillus (in: firmicutes)]|uniref:hypothetical protein n=1 Tax=unclassified Bacillus (in: firmicutes) TaxID=185979 RepID=UPI0008EB5615|nr:MULTISPECIES: hypothetical protein [unclassified Bacillus (in: firmicutes)]SFA76174.1 hypothetical protein SAMN02799634_101573 [Bacillus sp. UNCCL13]SFQ66095.1 hypothetical protein SAMN04488577_0848 [Bacillus sp. cl95]
MENVLSIQGNVKYSITIDPGVWIFDDRKIDLDTYSFKEEDKRDEKEEYTKAISKHWDREISEGAIYPPTMKTERKFEKERVLNGTFGIPFKPFLTNASPLPEAKEVTIVSSEGDITVPLDSAYEMILQFSQNGKPLKEDGPVHLFWGDGSNKLNPIRNIKAFLVK